MSLEKKSFILFSDDSCDSDTEDYIPKRTSASESDRSKKKGSAPPEIKAGASKKPAITQQDDVPKNCIEFDKTRIGTLPANTIIQYRKTDDKLIESKYFKKIDNIAGTIIVGFYTHNKKNYAESLSNIKAIYINSSKGGAEDFLKETIEIPHKDWKTIRRDMIITYQKKDLEYIHKAKFNSFVKGSDGSTRISFTSERGYTFSVSPDNIKKMYRHVTSNDKTLSIILEALRKLETRVRALEQKK